MTKEHSCECHRLNAPETVETLGKRRFGPFERKKMA